MGMDKDFCGVEFKLISVTKNKEYQCIGCSEWGLICDYKRNLMIEPDTDRIRFTEVIIQFRNTNSFVYSLVHSSFNIIDSDECQYSYCDLGYACENIFYQGRRYSMLLTLTPNSKITTALVFPELPNANTPHKLTYRSYAYLESSLAFEGYIIISLKDGSIIDVNASNRIIEARKKKIIEERAESEKQSQEQLMKHNERLRDLQSRRNNEQLSYIQYKLNDLQLLVFKRFNNILTYKESTNLDNKIKNAGFKLRQTFENNEDYNEFMPILSKVIEDYYIQISEEKNRLNTIYNKPDEDFSPRDFEIYVKNIFKSIGYTTKLTPYVGDGGIDIILEKEGLTYGVQCKYYQEHAVIGSPVMQQFVGALININAAGGFFVSTCHFSKNAMVMAKNNNIRLINLPRNLN